MNSTQKKYTVAIVGATGLVGAEMIKVLDELNFPVKKLNLLASEDSIYTFMKYGRKKYNIKKLTAESFKGVDIALFSAGEDVSREFAPIASNEGCVVIDNSSAWRMHPDAPLVVPEVNPSALKNHKGIIANPNCSTIQLVAVLEPLHKKFKLRRVVVSTYQSISGAGQKGVAQLHRELRGDYNNSPFPAPIAFNTIFHTIPEADGDSEEETKMIQETRKIMSLPDLKINVTCVRVPTLGGHGESVNIETEKPISPKSIRVILAKEEGIILSDMPEKNIYPMPILAEGFNEIFVGRIRQDNSVENGANLWIVADNIRKGAATNAVQIAHVLVKNDWLGFKSGTFS